MQFPSAAGVGLEARFDLLAHKVEKCCHVENLASVSCSRMICTPRDAEASLKLAAQLFGLYWAPLELDDRTYQPGRGSQELKDKAAKEDITRTLPKLAQAKE